MKMRKWLGLVIAACLILFVSACNSFGAEGESSSSKVTFTTGTTTGVYYPLGALLATHWTNDAEIQVTSQGSNGSVENLKLMQKDQADMAFSTVNIIWEAYNGKNSFEGDAYDDIRIMANLYPNVSHIIALDDSGIESVEDISGKSFVLGAAGSATELESKLILESHGVDIGKVNENYVGFTEAVDLMRNKQAQAVNIYTGVPASAATELISTVDSKVLNMTDEGIANMTSDDYPWNFEYVIEKGTYDGQEDEIRTVGQFSSIAVDANLDEETVYEMTKSLWENLDKLAEGHSVVKQFKPEDAVQGTADVPLHPGAERYYKEIGVLK
ncbi:TAXI family TRAP transporter solute-binding subunit [Bhargavaea beijingensis]|uniref:TAXI family TRAP transporter solute-binding subunit n=1 Tax=Bhargavaea beijingensis TaxID=426756 RepID=A0A1G7FVK8_9BACL|nr:TAXI family TRAP transporter solute-binding subunit [Bhargavaea beijingensis]MCW1927341.1 TAXI family TRAP transporter solute-binding subunit [Bhargavaea beijingensis]RSK33770.1 TAXI family TRAP transporter solute-binding subunit [Bhargavaea beijingensis]SDE79785.1 hypothetical protein SAMN04488126_12129 [Bhargavaea beijingensis]